MPPVSRLTDIALGHSSFPSTPAIEGCKTIIVNNLPAHTVGHAVQPHGSPSPSPVHNRTTASGSSNTIFENKPLAFIGSAVDCGGMLAQGSPDTIVN